MGNSNPYIVQNKTIIFDSKYDLPFNTQIIEILSNLDTIIFDEKKYISIFDQSVDNLPNSIRDITFGFSFN